MDVVIKKADILIEALPYIRTFRGRPVVVKYGGSAMNDRRVLHGILQDMVFMHYVGLRPMLVHGGGPVITERLAQRGVQAPFVDGRRVTDEATLEVVGAVLTELNAWLVHELQELGADAAPLSAAGGTGVVRATRAEAGRLGHVGVVSRIETKPLERLLQRGRVPVISPLGSGRGGQLYNVNADEVASRVASALAAEKLVLLTDVEGILSDRNGRGELISHVTVDDAARWIADGTIQAGMIPKVHACVHALAGGVRKTHIIGADVPHALLLEIFTDRGVGTEIVPADA